MTDEDKAGKEKKGCTLCKKVGSFLGDAFAVSLYISNCGAKGIAKGAKGAAKGAKNAYDWADEHSNDMKRGYLIGADIWNWFRYWNPAKVIKDIFRGEHTCPPTDEEFDTYSVGVEKAKEYMERHDDAPFDEKAPITAATLVGGIAGTLTYLVAHPFVSRHNKKKTKEMKGGLEEAVEE